MPCICSHNITGYCGHSKREQLFVLARRQEEPLSETGQFSAKRASSARGVTKNAPNEPDSGAMGISLR